MGGLFASAAAVLTSYGVSAVSGPFLRYLRSQQHDAALDATIAGVLYFLGLDTLTRAGARKVMDALIRQVTADR